MAQMVSRGGPGLTGAGVVTVADLLNRNAPVPVQVDDDDATRGISVGSLLRREGRAPHAIDRPIQPRAHQQAVEELDEAAPGKRSLVRRGTIAAGTLLAAGSVFGAAVLTEVGPTSGTDAQEPTADGAYPGQGLLDPGGAQTSPAGTVQLDEAASINTLDPGAPAPSAWIPIAFPGAVAGVPTGTAAAAAADAAVAASLVGGGGAGGVGTAPSGGTAGAGAAAGSSSGAAGDSSARQAGGGGGSSSASNDQQGVVGGVGDGLGDTANGVGDTVGGPVGETVGGLGDTVNDTTDTLDGAVSGLLGGGDDSDDDSSSRSSESARSFSAESSDSDGDSSSSSAPRDEDSSNDGKGSGGSSGGLLGTVGDLAGGLLG